MRLRVLLLAIIFNASLAIAGQPDAPKPVKIDFVRVVKPILEASCVKCHGADRYHGDLRLDTKELALASFGDLGKLITPGKPNKSTLYATSVLPDDDPLAMPIRDRDKLTHEQTELIREWIQQGADWPEDVTLKRITKVAFTTVASIIQTSCLNCHSKNKAEGGIRLDNRKAAFRDGKNGPSIVPYYPEHSRLCLSLTSPSPHDKKPPKLLFDEDIETLKEWVRQGAAWPDDMQVLGAESNDDVPLDKKAKK